MFAEVLLVEAFRDDAVDGRVVRVAFQDHVGASQAREHCPWAWRIRPVHPETHLVHGAAVQVCEAAVVSALRRGEDGQIQVAALKSVD